MSSKKGKNTTEPASNVFSINLLKTKGGKALALNLEKIHEELREIGQEDEEGERPKGLDEIAAQLVDPIITGNSDKDVRLTAACCLVDILRIYAPDAPYGEAELQSIFELLIKQLHGLSTVSKEAHSKKEQRYAYVLESLATVKSCIILTELIQQGYEDAEEQMSELFDCLLSNVRADQSLSIHAHVLDVLTCCLEELDTIPVPLLETFLIYLLPASKNDNPTAHSVVQVLLQRSFNKLQHPVGGYITALLDDKHEASELKEHVYSLVFELHKTHPQLMLYILPRLVEYLEVEDDVMRERIVQLVRRLFASSVGEYSKTYPQHFKTLLRRFKDRSPLIRKHMLEFGRIVLTRQAGEAFLSADQVTLLMEQMRNRLVDKDDAVRQQAVHDVCDMAFQSLHSVTDVLLRDVGERYSDKRADIRKDAITGLARIYSEHMSGHWESSLEEELWVSVPPDVEAKIGWVPQCVVLFAVSKHNSPAVKMRACQLFDDFVVSKDLEPNVRAAGLVYIYDKLTDTGKQALNWLLKNRSIKQDTLSTFVTLSRARAASPTDLDKEMKLTEFYQKMLVVFPTADKKATLLMKLSSSKDRTVFKLLDILASPDSSFAEVVKARENIPKALGSKTPLGEYGRDIARSAGMGFGGPEMMSAALMIADKAAEDGDDELAATTMDLLEMMMRNFPRLVHVVLSDILKLYAELGRGSASNATTTLRTRLLKLAEMSGAEVAKANWSKGNKAKAVDETSASEFTADMERVLFKDGNVQEAKHAVRLLSRMVQKTSSSPDSVSSSPSSGGKSKNPTSMETVERVAATLASPKQLKVENKRLLVFLHGLREVAKNFSEVFQNHALKVRKFVLSKVVLKISAQEGKGKSSKKQGFSEDCLRLCAALKLLSYDLSPGDKISDIIDEKDIDEEEDDTFVKGTVVDLLFNILDEEVPGDRSLSSSEMVQVRRVAACALLRIGAHFDFTPAQWHTLGWTMQDSEDRVRLKFMRTVAEAVKEVRVPLRFIAYMVLASGESEGVEKKNATESLLSAIKRLRQEHIKRMSALSEDSILDEGVSVMEASMMMDDGLDEERRILNTSLMPEYVLPYVVHLLAHHPDFPSSKTDVGRIKVCERNLKALLDPLIASLGHEADNISFLLQMFSKMVEHQDCLDGDTFRIHLIASIGKKALKKMIKSPESIKPYPGTIYLPTNLFVPRIADEEDKDEDMGGLNSGDESGKRAKSFPSPSDTWGSPIAPASDSTSRSNTKSRKRTSASSSKSKKSRLQDLLSSDDEEKDDDEEEVDEDEMEELVDMRIGGLGSPDNGRRNQPRGAKKGVEYLVKWSGKPASASTWEPVANISDKSLIVDFEKRSKAIEDAMAEQEELKSPKRARSSGGSRSKHVNQEEDDEAEEEDEESPNKSTNSSRSTKRGRRAKSPPPTAPSDEEQVEQEEPPAKATNKNTKLPKKSPKKKATKQTKPTPSKSPKGSKRAVEAAESSDSEEEVETLSRRRKGRR